MKRQHTEWEKIFANDTTNNQQNEKTTTEWEKIFANDTINIQHIQTAHTTQH